MLFLRGKTQKMGFHRKLHKHAHENEMESLGNYFLPSKSGYKCSKNEIRGRVKKELVVHCARLGFKLEATGHHTNWEGKFKTQIEVYLSRSLALMSTGFFLFSSANTTVSSLPRRICPSIWYFASTASAGSTYWTKPKPRGSLHQTLISVLQAIVAWKQLMESPCKQLRIIEQQHDSQETWEAMIKGLLSVLHAIQLKHAHGCWPCARLKDDFKFFKTWYLHNVQLQTQSPLTSLATLFI